MTNSIYSKESRDHLWVVYKITNKINNKSYIGVTTRGSKIRFKEHCSCNYNSVIRQSIKKHGVDNFKCEDIFVSFSKEYLKIVEKLLIEQHGTFGQYNMTTGGEGNFIVSEETKRKQSVSIAKYYEVNKKPPMTDATKAKISQSRLGKDAWNSGKLGIYSDESRKKMSESAKNRPPISEETREKKRNIWLGRTHSEESKKKMSIVQKGKNKGKISPFKGKEHNIQSRKLMSDLKKGIQTTGMLGKKHSIESINKMSNNRKGAMPPENGNTAIKLLFVNEKGLKKVVHGSLVRFLKDIGTNYHHFRKHIPKDTNTGTFIVGCEKWEVVQL